MSADESCTYQLPEHLHDDRLEGQELGCYEPRIDGWPYKGGPYCLFHVQDPASSEKEIGAFTEALKRKRDSNYRGFVFPKGTLARHLLLENADFTGAHFSHHADFSGLTFEGPTHFSGVTFEKRVNFKGATFHGNVSFGGATFKEDANFEIISFLQRKPGRPSHWELMDSAMGTVNFNKARFESLADFTNARFEVTSSFINSCFLGNTVFIRAKFCERANVNFSYTTFNKECDFIETRSSSRMNFYRSEFFEEAVFRNAILQGPTEFHGSVFKGHATFSCDRPNQLEEMPLKVRFVDMDMKQVAFRGANLREVSFWHCANLDRAELSACLWNNAINRQRVLYDEMALRGYREKWGSRGDSTSASATPTLEDWERAENTYRALRRNFDDKRDSAGASEFYVGEMEMRRLAKPRLERHLFSLEALYLHISTYGENWWKPLLWLLILLILSTSVYTGWGLKIENSELIAEDIVRIYWQLGTASFSNDIAMFGRSFIHSLSVLTFLRVSVAEPLHWTGQLMAILQLVLSPVLFTLTVLAIRRKLKR